MGYLVATSLWSVSKIAYFSLRDLIPILKAEYPLCDSLRNLSFVQKSNLYLTFTRYQLLYGSQFGGASAILSDQFKLVNGLSNQFDGWGGEDDDFSA